METIETKVASGKKHEELVLEVVEDLVRELLRTRGGDGQTTLHSRLDQDLGLDSLARSELLLRLEKACRVSLSDETLLAETPLDLVRAVEKADATVRGPAPPAEQYDAPEPIESTPARADTLLEVLDWHVCAQPERPHIHLYGETDHFETLSYGELARAARDIACGLQATGIVTGERVALMLPTGKEYFTSFIGVLMAGCIPVPIYPPLRPSQVEEHLRRQQKILVNAGVRALISDPRATSLARLLRLQLPELSHIVSVHELLDSGAEYKRPRAARDDIAFLQYTSGSTGDPKGVILSHLNLLSNLRAMGERARVGSTDVFISWLPLYHDMGLIGAWLGSLYYAYPLVVMSPLRFLARPARWLWAIHRHRGTLSASPNFGYEFCIKKIADEEIEGLSLASWRQAFNGAERVSHDTLESFCQRFARYGFHRQALRPVYGLAESSLCVAMPRPDSRRVTDRIQREAFFRDGRALPTGPEDPNPLRVVSCGQPLLGEEVRIVDPTGREVPERQEGTLEFRGPSATRGYYHNPEATAELFHGDWLDSGDRAYAAEGNIYITGRNKDVIIRGGRNIYPTELDDLVGEIPGIRKGCVAAFGLPTEPGNERLIVVAETKHRSQEEQNRLRRDIEKTTADLLAIPPDDIVLVPPHAVLKTSSGKIRRAATRELYERGVLGRPAAPVWWQLVRLTASSLQARLRAAGRVVATYLYSAHVWSMLSLIGAIAWIGVVILPVRRWRWALVRTCGRLFFLLSGIRVLVGGSSSSEGNKPAIFVANHMSYLDGLVLSVTLPRDVRFVAKKELLRRFFARVFLKRLNSVFVERFAAKESVESAGVTTAAARSGGSLMFFPEGTFKRSPGLLPFRLGAFISAAKAQRPVVPVAIRGTRSILRAGAWFFRKGEVEVFIGEPIEAKGSDWDAAVSLHHFARQVILQHCGEPDLWMK